MSGGGVAVVGDHRGFVEAADIHSIIIMIRIDKITNR